MILFSSPESELFISIILFKIAHIGPAEFAAAVNALEIGLPLAMKLCSCALRSISPVRYWESMLLKPVLIPES